MITAMIELNYAMIELDYYTADCLEISPTSSKTKDAGAKTQRTTSFII
jgi:hypothetical protein